MMNSDKIDPKDRWTTLTTLLEAARSHYYNNEFLDAIQKYKEILALATLKGSEEGTIRCELGYALLGAGDHERAISESLAALKLNSAIRETYGVHNTLGSSYFIAQEYAKAVSAHSAALGNSQTQQQKLRSTYQLGRSHLMDGSPELALERFKECLEALSDDDLETKLDIQYNLGFCYAQLDKRFNSERSFRSILSDATRPEDVAKAYFGLMQLHIGLEDYPKVIEYGKLTLEKMPDFSERETVVRDLRIAASKVGVEQFSKTWDTDSS